MICEYEAADTETMRRIQREAGAEFDRIWVGEAIEWAGVRRDVGWVLMLQPPAPTSSHHTSPPGLWPL